MSGITDVSRVVEERGKDDKVIELFYRYLGGRMGTLQALNPKQSRDLTKRIEATIDNFVEEEETRRLKVIIESALAVADLKTLRAMAEAVR